MERRQIERITNYIFLPAQEVKADLILIFGTSLLEPPVDRAGALYAAGLSDMILVSGGNNRHSGLNEAHTLAAMLVERGVLSSELLIEDRSINSLENVLHSKRIIEEELGWSVVRKVLVVCKNYHSRRALMTLKRHFPQGTELLPAPYDLLGITRDNWHQTNLGRERVLSEWDKIPKYLAQGDIVEL